MNLEIELFLLLLEILNFLCYSFTALEEEKALLDGELLKYQEDVKIIEEAMNMLESQATDYKQEIISLKSKEEKLMATLRQGNHFINQF